MPKKLNFTQEQMDEIKTRAKNEDVPSLAKFYGCSMSTIRKIINEDNSSKSSIIDPDEDIKCILDTLTREELLAANRYINKLIITLNEVDLDVPGFE